MRKQIAVEEETHKELVRFAKKHGYTQGEAVSKMLRFFKKTGSDPDQEENSASEIAKLTSRVEQVIKFQRVFEKDKLAPVITDIMELTEELKKTKPSELSRGLIMIMKAVGYEKEDNKMILKENIFDEIKRSETATKRNIDSYAKSVIAELKEEMEELSKTKKKGLF